MSKPHIRIHRLVGEEWRRTLSQDVQADIRRVLCETASYVAVASKRTTWSFLGLANNSTSNFEEELLRFVLDCVPMIMSHRSSSLDWDANLEELGKVCQAKGKFVEAAKLYEVELEKTRGPEDHILRIKRRLAIAQIHMNRQPMHETTSDGETVTARFEELIRASTDEADLRALKLHNSEQNDSLQELAVLEMILEQQETMLGFTNPSTLESILELSHRLID